MLYRCQWWVFLKAYIAPVPPVELKFLLDRVKGQACIFNFSLLRASLHLVRMTWILSARTPGVLRTLPFIEHTTTKP